MTVIDQANPTVARRELAVYFRNLREKHERSLEALAKQLKVSGPQASRLDKGVQGLSLKHLRRLADWYDVDKAELDRLLVLAEETKRRAWWQQVELDESYRTLIGMEQKAASIREFCSGSMPGLLQTHDYAVASARSSGIDVTDEQAQSAADIRIRRQDVFERADPPSFWVVIDEVAIRRASGGTEVMRAQLERLCAAAERPGTTVQVISFDYGSHPGPWGHLMLLDMPDPLPPLTYFENKIDARDSSDPDEVAHAGQIWTALVAAAENDRNSLAIIRKYM